MPNETLQLPSTFRHNLFARRFMHHSAELIHRFYTSFGNRDTRGMTACYHPAVKFSDEVLTDLEGARAVGMWQMLCERAKDLRVEFREGKITRHRDSFDFWAWASQALGPTGSLLGWSGFLKNRVRSQATNSLAAFLRKTAVQPTSDER